MSVRRRRIKARLDRATVTKRQNDTWNTMWQKLMQDAKEGKLFNIAPRIR